MRFWRSQPASPVAEERTSCTNGIPHPEGAAVLPYTLIESHAEVAQLAGLVLDPARRELVVVLSSRSGEGVPSLDAEDVRQVVGASALIYFLVTGTFSIHFADRMPGRRGPFNGSLRVWLPGFSGESDHREHPSVFDPTGEYGAAALRQLAYALREACFRRDVEPQVNPLVAYRSLALVRVGEEAELRILALERELTQAEEERDEAALRAHAESEEAVRRARTERDDAIRGARGGQLPRKR